MSASTQALTMRRIYQTWWPLAAGWLLMTVEIPVLTAVIARAPEPKINLAAWGIAFVMTLILGSPAIMLLATSTTFSKDWASYVTLRRYMVVALALFTVIHALLAFTPLFDLIVVGLIGAPADIVEPARLGVMIMLPWSAGVGYRRFNYGVLIRFGQARAITVGVLFRLGSDVILLSLFYLVGGFSGLVMATTTFTLGIIAEGIYSRVRVHSILQGPLKQATPVKETLTLALFLSFFVPLALTSILQTVAQPIVSAGLSRMPNPLESLAVWPVVYGLLIIFTSAGMSYTEVVVVLLDEPHALSKLRRFTTLMGSLTIGLLLIMSATPLAELWFRYVAAIPDNLVQMAIWGLWILLPLPGLRVLESWYQGILINGKQTRGITESVLIFLGSSGLFLGAGVLWGGATGLYVGLFAMVFGDLMRTAWLWYRTRPKVQAVQARDAGLPQHV